VLKERDREKQLNSNFSFFQLKFASRFIIFWQNNFFMVNYFHWKKYKINKLLDIICASDNKAINGILAGTHSSPQK